ncbi:Uncharacterized protein HZ326_16455 [Fusarium oxysporum f. sp. albedinis]|nr:Uncharacterized protein HZ326_16455 [Fusarium oxysporum f. sp. albedinis]
MTTTSSGSALSDCTGSFTCTVYQLTDSLSGYLMIAFSTIAVGGYISWFLIPLIRGTARTSCSHWAESAFRSSIIA